MPEFILELRSTVGTAELWLTGVTAVILRDAPRGSEGAGYRNGAAPGGDVGVVPAAPQEILLVRRSDNGAWTPVTGIVDPGEHPADTAVREAAEEAGVRIAVDHLAWVNVTELVVYPNGDRARYLDHTFACHWLDGDPAPADDECTDARWWPLDAMPPMSEGMSHRISVVLDALARGDRTTRLAPYDARP